MRAWEVNQPGPVDSGPLRLVERPVPEPGPGQLRIRVSMCGVCRTDLHLIEGDLPAHQPHTIPGHEVVGYVDRLGEGCADHQLGQRVGAAWLARTCGHCRFCCQHRENLCLAPTFTGWDIDGGFAEYMVADEQFVYQLPDCFEDDTVAPLLCAGIIGYRALRRAELPTGGRLGMYGFGGSAHLTAQVALAQGATLHVITRSAEDQELARALGAASVGGSNDRPPEPLDAAILFAPAGDLVPPALAALDRGGTLAVAGIHLTDIPPLHYQTHLFQERTLRSVTANTREDGQELLAVAERIGMRVTTTPYPFEAVDKAVSDLAHDRFSGAAIIRVAPAADRRRSSSVMQRR
ncbi:zinc-dependent alcohol dehydrogenase family protein [Candidatus Mycobacterium methanotrophicum]|uniref:alcohol dehydrogenase n=1 Tax=Candidatus Mycobacterium methanotrophicum TaxID=2943498 RepID=A0ABY4QR06_9MYCO|nr:zinc-dependent alcohol dehydrogenase family protein [Candidatus Mycobacterium methanotrophicum]UQX13069.1 zinc-dependent alcohol dehydrogenase family protein [Candidatus Mycobacterium methanotrophicum]